MAKAQHIGPDGNAYKPMQYPIYRKIGDQNQYKMISAEIFINARIVGDASIIGHGLMAPAALAGFIAGSTESTQEEYGKLYFDILKKIEDA